MSCMRILVTGGTGFLGSHLCDRLIQKNECVVCMDNNYTGSLDNVACLLEHPNFTFIEHDITEPYDFEEKIDRIYNFACPASPVHYQGKAALATSKTCYLGALNMLELAKRHSARILQASTSEVYGDPLVHPQIEEYRGNVNPTGVRACYDEGKRIAETLFFDYHREMGVDIKVVRIFNTYGPRMSDDDGRVVSNFICQALRGEDISIYGDGAQTRSFCYVDDLIEAVTLMMDSPAGVTGPLNIGNPVEFTVSELAEKITRKIKTAGKISHYPLPADDPLQRRPDIAKARTLLGWEPKINLDQGLDKTIEYFLAVTAQTTCHS